MWNLSKPSLADSISDLSNIAAHSRYLTPAHFPVIETLYRSYDIQNGKITNTEHNSIPYAARKGLRLAYDKTYGQDHHSNISNEIKSGIDKCPMCDIGNATTLDHYMEKETWEAVAILRQNLVPMCYDCNTTRNKNGLKHTEMLHAYYDILPIDRQWLIVDLKFGAGVVVATFHPDSTVLTDVNLYNKAKKTIEDLGLNETFRKEISSFLTQILHGKCTTNLELRTILTNEATRYRTLPDFGINHWKTVLLCALADYVPLTLTHLTYYINR